MLRAAAEAIKFTSKSVVQTRLVTLSPRCARPSASCSFSTAPNQHVLDALKEIITPDHPDAAASPTSDKASPPAKKGRNLDRQGVLFVGGLTNRTDEDMLRTVFESYGEIQAIKLKRMPDGRSRRFAYVEFEPTSDAVQRVLANHATCPVHVDEHRVTISPPLVEDRARRPPGDAATLYIDNLPDSVRQSNIKGAFREWKPLSVRIYRRHKPTREVFHYAFVRFATAADAQDVLVRSAAQPFTIGACTVRVSATLGPAARVPTPTRTLFVQNLPSGMARQHLSACFERFGNVKKARIQTASGGRKGFGFVEFASVEDATAAMEAHRQKKLIVFGRGLSLAYSTPFIASRYEQGQAYRDVLRDKAKAAFFSAKERAEGTEPTLPAPNSAPEPHS